MNVLPHVNAVRSLYYYSYRFLDVCGILEVEVLKEFFYLVYNRVVVGSIPKTAVTRFLFTYCK